MGIEVFSINRDEVVNSIFITGCTTYQYALDNFYPLINRFDAQRKLQNKTFYERLKRDIVRGCVMPPLTLSIVDENDFDFIEKQAAAAYIEEKLSNGYVLDGMQRLNTLKSASDDERFDPDRPLYFNILISKSKDTLLYRMITLNNGQKPMSARHQIEVLTEELFDFTELKIDIQTEKERSEKVVRGAFNLSDISKGYLAYFTNNLNNDNNKIIAEKMDEIIARKIMDFDIEDENRIEFQSILKLIDQLSIDEEAKKWLQIQNNLIGFCLGVKNSYKYISNIEAADFGRFVLKFDEAFKGINAAKVNLGKYRRELSFEYIKNIENLHALDELSLLDHFSEIIAS